MSARSPLGELIAEIGRAPDLEVLQRLRRALPATVFERWRTPPGEEPDWGRILSEVQTIGRAFEDRRAELQAAAPAGGPSQSAETAPAAGSKRRR